MDGRATLIRRSMVLTFALTRAWLWFRPNADFNVGAYNIHHLFTGALVMSAAGMVASLDLQPRSRDACAAIFGVGLALTLDEWIYLIVTDGTNASYWTDAVGAWRHQRDRVRLAVAVRRAAMATPARHRGLA